MINSICRAMDSRFLTVNLHKVLVLALFLFTPILFLNNVVSNAQDYSPNEKLQMLIRVESQPFMTDFHSFAHGYYVYRGKIQNLDKRQAHQITIQQDNSIIQQDNPVLKIFELKAGESANISLPLPVTSTCFGCPIRIVVDGYQTEIISLLVNNQLLTDHNLHDQNRFFIPTPDISVNQPVTYSCLVCQSLLTSFSETDSHIKVLLDCKYWPQDRLDYSCLDVIFLTPDELVQAPKDVQNALQQFVQAGGELYLFNCKNQQESLEKITWINSPQKESNPEVIYPTTSERKLTADNDGVVQPKIIRYPLAFGKLVLIDFSVSEFQEILLPDCSEGPLVERMLETIRQTRGTRSSVWFSIHDINDWQKQFPIVENLEIPRREIIIAIIVFVLLAGPINFLVLSYMNKRIWIFVTIPVLSFLFVGTMYVYINFHGGFQTEARISSITCLDQRSGSYTSMGQLGIYARTRANGVAFEPTDELNCVTTDSFYDEHSPLTVNWTTGMQRVDSSFAPIRTPVYYKFRKTGTTRLKLEFDFNASAPYVVNGLGKDIKTLYVSDENGSLWMATDVSAGQKTPLKFVSEKKTKEEATSTGRGDFSTRMSKLVWSSNWDMNSLLFDAGDISVYNTIPKNTYIATLDSPGPFVNKGISYAKSKKDFSFIFGKL